MAITLRDYQLEVVSEVRGGDMVVMPTGTGKSAVIAAVAQRYTSQGLSVLVVVPTVELKNQLAATLRRWAAKAEVAVWKSAQGLKHDVWLHDECHHSAAASWDKLLTANPEATHIGFTATPVRLDGRPLKGFSRLLEPHPVGWYMERGYLCPELVEYTIDLGVDWPDLEDLEAAYQRLDRGSIYGCVVDNYLQLAPKAKSVVFATTIAHCEKVCQSFQKAGVASEVIHSGMKAAERKRLMEHFQSGALRQLVNVYVLGEGVDVPDVDTVVMLRPTASAAMYYQWVGRALRPGKARAVVLDFVGNVLRHGSVTHNQGWAVEYAEALERELLEESFVCLCANCGEILKYPGQTCPACGHRRERLAKGGEIPKERRGELKQLALSPFAVQIVRASHKGEPVKGANMLLRHKSLYRPGDGVLLMQYLSRCLDRDTAGYYYREITS